MILQDNETTVDLLNYRLIAKSICKLIKSSTESVTLGVHGDWGAGKSSVLLMVDKLLSDDDKYLCIKFNSWRYQGFEDVNRSHSL